MINTGQRSGNCDYRILLKGTIFDGVGLALLRAKDDLGLDHCEARSWHGWHRHMSLVTAAAAFLAKLAPDQRRAAFEKQNERSPVPALKARLHA